VQNVKKVNKSPLRERQMTRNDQTDFRRLNPQKRKKPHHQGQWESG